MKKHKLQKQFLEQLTKMPIVATACEKLNLSRQTIYRWQQEDPEFTKLVEEARFQGDSMIHDMVENQFLREINNGKWPAIKYHLDKRHPKYASKVSDTSHIQGDIADPIKLAEANILSLLKSGDKDITKWYLGKTSYRYADETVADKRQEFLAQQRLEKEREMLNRPITLKPGSEKYFQKTIIEEEVKKRLEEEKKKWEQSKQSQTPPATSQ